MRMIEPIRWNRAECFYAELRKANGTRGYVFSPRCVIETNVLDFSSSARRRCLVKGLKKKGKKKEKRSKTLD